MVYNHKNQFLFIKRRHTRRFDNCAGAFKYLARRRISKKYKSWQAKNALYSRLLQNTLNFRPSQAEFAG
jgi:uncharacterized protein YfaT (DUF1175 family)